MNSVRTSGRVRAHFFCQTNLQKNIVTIFELEGKLEPMSSRGPVNNHPKIVARRFQQYLDRLQQVHTQLQVSQLAEEFGYEHSRFLDQLRDGTDYLSWEEIEDFCARANINATWFNHGKGKPFEPSNDCYVDLTSLLNDLPETTKCWLYIVRSGCTRGRVCFVRQDNEFALRVHDTLLHLSAVNGAGGARNLLAFYGLMGEIDSVWPGRKSSLTLPLRDYERLLSGDVFPGQILLNKLNSYWADDFRQLDLSDEIHRSLAASHGPEFRAAQAIVRSQLERAKYDTKSSFDDIDKKDEKASARRDEKTVACPVCGIANKSGLAVTSVTENELSVECPRCGHFCIEEEALGQIRMDAKTRFAMSAWIREHQEAGIAQPTILVEQLDQIVSSFPKHGIQGKLHVLLTTLAQRTNPAETTSLVLEEDFVLASAKSAGELRLLLNDLKDKRFINVTYKADRAICELTLSGWQELESSEGKNKNRAQAFVAMSFDMDLEPVWLYGIKPAIESQHYEAYKVNEDPHLDRIDEKILREIERSKFVIADVTTQKQGVYFEAGYTLGQGIPVIWCVRDDEISKLHFDTRQFKHVIWKSPEDLRPKLSEQISGAIGKNIE